MTTRNWKRIQPNSLVHAMRLCKDHALERKKRSVERIADLMAVSADALYKWLATGRMPAVLIPAYEHVCGINFVSRWLAASAGQLVVDMPKGKPAAADDLMQVNSDFSKALQLLSDFYAAPQGQDPAAVLEALRGHMQTVAFHHHNVAHYATPELEFGE